MSSDDDTGDDVPLAELISGMKLPSAQTGKGVTKVLKKAKPKRKRKKKDPNEPQKPISAYALFFKDTQAAIKSQNPGANFGEVSKIVASMWDGLEMEAKNVYKKTAEAAKKEYLKALALYRAKLASEGVSGDSGPAKNSSPAESSSRSNSPAAASPPGPSSPQAFVNSSEKAADAESPEIEAQSAAPQVINLADSPELLDGNDKDSSNNNVDDDEIQEIPLEDSSLVIQELSGDEDPFQHNQSFSEAEVVQSMSSPSGQDEQQLQHDTSEAPVNGDIPDISKMEIRQTCLRSGCNNLAIDSPEWDREYCSSECVVYHCRDVFNAWVASKRMSPTY